MQRWMAVALVVPASKGGLHGIAGLRSAGHAVACAVRAGGRSPAGGFDLTWRIGAGRSHAWGSIWLALRTGIGLAWVGAIRPGTENRE